MDNPFFFWLSFSSIIYSTSFPLLSDSYGHSVLLLSNAVNAEGLKESLPFKYGPHMMLSGKREWITSVDTKMSALTLYRAIEVCSQGWTMEHDQALSKSPVADCLELIRSAGSFWQTCCNWIHLLVKDHKG